VQAELASALRTDTPTLVALADVAEALYTLTGTYAGVADRRAQGHATIFANEAGFA
jgi:hypothetical protein